MDPSAGADVLEVLAISDREWHVCDRRLPAADSARGVAYISRLNDSRFMVTGLGGQHGWMLFGDYAAALDAIRARSLGGSLDGRSAA